MKRQQWQNKYFTKNLGEYQQMTEYLGIKQYQVENQEMECILDCKVVRCAVY
jgi:hypothetical protein